MTASPEWIDVSRPLSAALAGWPGDVPFSFKFSWRIADGASVNVGAVETSVHAGTHIDAPFHYSDAGAAVEQLPVAVFAGPAWVVDVTGLEDWGTKLAGLDFAGTPRVLFRTGDWPNSSRFPERIPSMAPAVADDLGRRGVKLVGVDLPSVDQLDSKTLDVHHALGRHGVAILEGLWLNDLPEGRYELIALPLKLVGADGSPVRAVVRPLQ